MAVWKRFNIERYCCQVTRPWILGLEHSFALYLMRYCSIQSGTSVYFYFIFIFYLFTKAQYQTTQSFDTSLEGKSGQTWAEDAPWAGRSLHHPKSHTALQPRKSLAWRTRRSQAREASEQAGQGPTGACGNSRDQEQRGLSPREREGAGGGGRALRFKKPPKSVLKPNTMSKPNLTRHKVGDLLANF